MIFGLFYCRAYMYMLISDIKSRYIKESSMVVTVIVLVHAHESTKNMRFPYRREKELLFLNSFMCFFTNFFLSCINSVLRFFASSMVIGNPSTCPNT